MTERAWMGQLDSLARMFGYRIWHDSATNVPRTCYRCGAPIKVIRNAPGFPDRVYVRGDTLIFVEGKADRGKVTLPQREWLAALALVKRVRVFVWRPTDAEVAARALR